MSQDKNPQFQDSTYDDAAFNSIQPGTDPSTDMGSKHQDSTPKDSTFKPQESGADRGMPGLGVKTKKNPAKLAAIWGGIIIALLIMGICINWFLAQAKSEIAKPRLDQATTTTAGPAKEGKSLGVALDKDMKDLALADRKERLTPPAAAMDAGSSAPADVESTGSGTSEKGSPDPEQPAKAERAAPGDGQASKSEGPTAVDRKTQGSVLAYEAKPKGFGPGSSPTGARTGFSEEKRSGPDDGLDDQLTSSVLAKGNASRLPDLRYLLKRGTMLPCVENTKIVTNYPGMVSCHLTTDVYSADGSTLLLERGSEVTGEQRKGVQRGQNRIFVLWNEVDTPHGVRVTIASPGTDALGATGVEAWVDDHWWQRFGGAIMLSIIDDAFASALRPSTNQTVTFTNSSNTAQEMAAKALESTINIPPTAYSNHGSRLQIYVARDVDFKEIYDVRAR